MIIYLCSHKHRARERERDMKFMERILAYTDTHDIIMCVFLCLHICMNERILREMRKQTELIPSVDIEYRITGDKESLIAF